ncbi:MAG: c-type cytochrome [Gammaproteobacteria bacterium]|nr:c-type cytochrome [Gammaproteobacteria bacterium]MBU1447318.1 c-type cytochrome [Gammaproteobacteria bacterium]
MKLIFLVLGMLPLLAQAADMATKINVSSCEACHGQKGVGKNEFPRLAALEATYFVKQLQDFRTGTRSNPMMQPVAKSMSEADMSKYAAYFSKLPQPAAQPSSEGAALLAAGESLAKNGDWPNGIPACFQCHGAKGQGISPDFPQIAGQPARYITVQIANWKSGARSNDSVGLMKSVADKMTDEQIKAVAAYLSQGVTK